MTEMITFSYHHDSTIQQVRTIQIDGKIWFVGADVAKALGYAKPSNAIITHCKPKGTLKQGILTAGGRQEMVLIDESNIYRLIVRSTLPTADKFDDWVFEDVLPSIRKTGYYARYAIKHRFVIRYNLNWKKVEKGYFSVISYLFIILYGKLEHEGYLIPDSALDGKEMRPDVSVGLLFSKYLKNEHPIHAENFKLYSHEFENGKEVDARQYPYELLPYFIKFVEEIWIPEYAELYFKERDPKALDYIPRLLKAS